MPSPHPLGGAQRRLLLALLAPAALILGLLTLYPLARLLLLSFAITDHGFAGLENIAATAVLVAVAAWNEFLFAFLFMQSPSGFTLPTAIATRINEDETLWG